MNVESIRILFIEDSSTDVELMVRAIQKFGYHILWRRVETEAALLVALHQEQWDIIICDYVLPSFSCDKALSMIQALRPNIPFIIVSGAVQEDIAMPLVMDGAVDFIGKDRLWRIPLSIKREMRNFNERMKQRLILEQSFGAVIGAWGSALDLRDHSTRGHTLRVTNHAVLIATRNNVSSEVLKNVYFGSLLHDIGKIGIPDSILNKKEPLTEEEWAIMKTHPTLAYNFLKDIPFLQGAIDIPYCHHERWNGSGYPRGLSGNDIPLCARIFSLADVYDALTHDRPYRKALKVKHALRVMNEMEGWFDPKLFADFMEHEGEIHHGQIYP